MQMHRCPNLCCGGKVKRFSGDSALFDMIPCQMCRGLGEIVLPAGVTPDSAYKRWEAQGSS